MKSYITSSFVFLTLASFSVAEQSETKRFTSAYNVSVATPKNWVWDSEAVRDAKVSLAEMITTMHSDGKIRILNTGTPPASPDGYARIRLSITSNAQFSQKELRDLNDRELQELTRRTRADLVKIPVFSVSEESVAVTKTRANGGYWAYRISYTRTGPNGPVRVEQYYVPFSNRAVSLTLSYELSHKEKLAPILLRVWSSIELDDVILWPVEKD